MLDPTILESLVEIAEEAGARIMAVRKTGPVAAVEKDDLSPVTAADLAANDVIIAGLKSLSSAPIISEESKRREVSSGEDFWLVDPLDGTKDFIAGRDEFTVNIALIQEGIPTLGVVYAPALGETFWGSKGRSAYKKVGGKTTTIANRRDTTTELTAVVSRMHSCERTKKFINDNGVEHFKSFGSSLKFCRLAEGVIDVYPRYGPTCEWDIAAGHAVLSEANCIMINANTGGDMEYGKGGDWLNTPFVASRSNLTWKL